MKKLFFIITILCSYSLHALQAIDVFQDVIAKGKNPNVLLEYKPDGGTDFIQFLKESDKEKLILNLKSLIAKGLNKEIAFSQAVEAGNISAVKLLLQRGISSYEPLFANLKTSHGYFPDTPFKLFILSQDKKTIQEILRLLMNTKGFDPGRALRQVHEFDPGAISREASENRGTATEILQGRRPGQGGKKERGPLR